MNVAETREKLAVLLDVGAREIRGGVAAKEVVVIGEAVKQAAMELVRLECEEGDKE